MGSDGQEIVELLKENISLTNLYYEHNYFDIEFQSGVRTQLHMNKCIVDYIFPQLNEQERQVRKAKKEIVTEKK